MDDRIDLVDIELRQLADRISARTSSQPFGLYVLPSNAPGAELARHVERVVFEETFGNSPELLEQEYGPYEPASIFFCVVDHRRRRPAGMLRVIRHSPAGFKSLHDLERLWGDGTGDLPERSGVSLTPGSLWDVATLAVAPDYRGRAASGLVSMTLYQALNQASRRYGIDQLITILDVGVLRLLQRQLAQPFIEFAGVGAKRYLGSDASLPVWSDLLGWADRLATADPSMHDLMFDGRGLEAVVAPPDWRKLDLVTATSSSAR
jgi:hypothetical protein